MGSCGLEVPDVLLAYWWVRSATDMAGGLAWDSPEWCWPAGELGLIPGQWMRNPECFGAGAGLLVGGHGDQELVGMLDPGMRGCSYVVVFGLVSAYQWAGSWAIVSGCRALEVIALVCWPAGRGPGPSGRQDRQGLEQLGAQGLLRPLAD